VEAALRECREIAEQLGDPLTLAYVPQVAGMAVQFAGDMAQAITLLEEALAGFRAVGFLTGEVYALMALGIALGFSGDLKQAEGRLEECIAITCAWTRSVDNRDRSRHVVQGPGAIAPELERLLQGVEQARPGPARHASGRHLDDE